MNSLDTWGVRRRVVAITTALAFASLVAAWPAIDAYGRAAVVFGDAVLHAPMHRIAWAMPDPVHEELHWPDGGYGLLTRPDAAGRHPALLLILGAEPADPDDPRVLRLTGALARIGFVVLLARSEPLIDGRVTPDEVPLLVGAFRVLQQHPSVRGDRVGLVGLSTGGSLQLVTAADPAIADSVGSVLAIGSYYDAGTLSAEVLSRTYRTDAGLVAWSPDETAVRVVRNTLLAALPPDEEATVVRDAEPATEDGRVVRELLRAPSLDGAVALLERLSPQAHAQMTAISPSAHLAGMRAPLYLLHDRSDPFIPLHHSDAVAAHYPPAAYHRLDIFQHVEPRPSSVGVLLRDGSRMLRMFAEIIRAARA